MIVNKSSYRISDCVRAATGIFPECRGRLELVPLRS